MRRTAILLLMIFVLMMFAACGNVSETGKNSAGENFCTVTDDNGRTVNISKKPERIVVVSASFLEPLHEVGGSVVGRPSSKIKVPDFAKDAEDIGPVYQIDTEKLLACRPDLVIVNKGMNERLSTILDENKINFVVADMKEYENVKKNVLMFAEITGQPEKGKEVVADMETKIKNIKDNLPAESKRVAILHGTAQGISVQLDGSIAGNVLKILGWENVAAGMKAMEGKPDTAPYSLETLIEQNPEIIFVTSMGNIDEIKKHMDATISENPAWQTIPAVKNNQLYYLPQDLFLLSPGIHYPEAAEYAAKLIYPEVFK